MLRRLLTRRDVPGALVVLADGRFAVTNDGLIALGGQRQLSRYRRGRIRRAESPAARAWWEEVARVVSQAALATPLRTGELGFQANGRPYSGGRCRAQAPSRRDRRRGK